LSRFNPFLFTYRSVMKKAKTIIFILAAIAILALIKIFFLDDKKSQQAGPQPGRPQVTTVTAYIVKPEKLENRIFVTGTLLANEEVNLVPETAGKVTGIYFQEGSKVSKGQLLVRINDADLQAQLKKLQLEEKLAAEKEARQKKLLVISAVSQEEYDAALTSLNSIKADIEIVQAQISKAQITAPFSGIIGLKNISEGGYVNTSTSIASIQQTDPLKIDFFIPEKYASLVGPNDTISFFVEGSPERYTARILAIEPKVNVSTRTIQIRALTSNRSGKLFPGSFARIEFSLERSENAIMIPTEAVIPILKGQKVFISRNGKAEESIIETGVRTEDKVQVLKGLQPGDTVITTGIMQLRAGNMLKFASVQ